MQVEKSAIKRLENNHYAMDKAYDRLKEAIEVNHEQEIYTATGELLLWVITSDEWHKRWNEGYKRKKSRSEKGELLFGLLHAYNSMKHNMGFINIHRVDGGSTLPTTFPMEFKKISIRWINSKDVLEEGYEDSIRNYKKYIEEKEIMVTLDQAIEFLEQENIHVKEN